MRKPAIDIDLRDPVDDCPNILLVEDDEADAALIASQVKSLWPRCKILAVKSLQDAYTTYKDKEINLCLLDLNLPDGMGPATVAEMRKFSKRIPVVVITGMGTDLTVREALKLGANHVVLKSSIMDPDFKEVLKETFYLRD